MSSRNLALWAAVLVVSAAPVAGGETGGPDCPTPHKKVEIELDCSVSEDWVVIFKNSHGSRAGRANQVCWQASALENGNTVTLERKYGNDDEFQWPDNKKEIHGSAVKKWVLSGPPVKTGDFHYEVKVTRDSDGYEHCSLDSGVIIRD